MIRAILAIPLIALVTMVLGAPALVTGLLDRRGGLPNRITRTWARLVLRILGVRVAVTGGENVPAGPAIFAANHGSALDIPILFGHLPAEFRIIHKRSLYLIPLVGWFLYLGGHIGIDRANPFRARRSLETAAERIRRGTSVAVFPEGTRSPDPAGRPFRRGSFRLAIQAGAPVVPVSLCGVKSVVPRGLFSLEPGDVRMIVHAAVPTAGRAVEAADALAEEVRRIVVSGCEEA
jgi:1-acyl-sn-glycerol-3-phosphate acyltransferase